MLKKKKIVLMSKLAVYEKNEAKYMLKAEKYFRGDYISWNVIKTIISITLVYIIGVAVWFIYNSEVIMSNLAMLNYYAIIRYAVTLYAVLVIGYGVIAYMVYSVKYKKASKCIEKYDRWLKQLAKIYVEERNSAEAESQDDFEEDETDVERE